MEVQNKIKKISSLRSSIRPAKRCLLATTKRRIKDLLAKKEASNDHMIQAKYDKEIKSARGVIGCLKTMQTVDIIKFGLRTDVGELQAILQKGIADVNTRALARLCSKNIVQKAFTEFKANHPDWKKIPISEFNIVKGAQKSKQNTGDKKVTKGKKAAKLRKNNDKELADDQNEVKVKKSPKKKGIVKTKVASPVKKTEQSKVQSPKKILSPKKVQSPKKVPSPKKQTENVDESKDMIKPKLSKKVKSNASPVKVTPSPAKKLNKKRKAAEAVSNVSSGRESSGLPDKTPKRVKFDDELTKTQKNKIQPESTPKSELKPIIKKTPSDTKQKIQKPTKGNSLSERRKRNKLSM